MNGEVGLEAIKTVGPFGVRVSQPLIHRQQALELKSRRAALAVADSTNETGPLENLEVLSDRRLRQRGGLCQLDDASLSDCKALEDRPAGGIGKGCKGAAQGIIDRHYPQVI
jgi:hypothetical protein